VHYTVGVLASSTGRAEEKKVPEEAPSKTCNHLIHINILNSIVRRTNALPPADEVRSSNQRHDREIFLQL
jgi:hypothetical protein